MLRNIDKFYNAFYSLSVLLDIQRKTKILQSLAYYLRVLVREGLWIHGLYGYAAQYLYDFTSFDTTPYAKKLLEMFYKFQNSAEGTLSRYSVSLDDKSQEYISRLKDLVFNINDKNGCDDAYLKKIISYFGQLQNEAVHVTSCYETLAVYICLIRKNKINDVLQHYDDMERKGLFGELPSGYVRGHYRCFGQHWRLK